MTQSKNSFDVHHLKSGTLLNNGQYQIVRTVGEGGFGITYEAIDNLGRSVAIKECFPSHFAHRSHGRSVRPTSAKKEENFETARRNFLREAKVLAAIDHPNVVKVRTFFEENETAYLAMDYIQGTNLDDVILNEPDKLTPNYVFRISHDLLTALDHLHENRVLHRDIKPSNIRVDRWGTPILIDFGTAKQITSSETAQKTTREIVSDGYSPLEFYERGEQQGEASDLYSLAATLHHLITGTVPPPAQQRAKRVWEGKPDSYVPLAGRFMLFDGSLLTLIDRAMSLDLKQRPVDAKAWLRTLPDINTVTYHPKSGEPPKEKRKRWPDVLFGSMGGAAVAAAITVFLLPGFLGLSSEQSIASGAFIAASSNGGATDVELAAMRDRMDQLVSDLEVARAEASRLARALEEAEGELEQLENSEALSEMRGERDAALARVNELTSELESVESEIDLAETSLRVAEDQARTRLTLIGLRDDEIADLRNERRRLLQALNDSEDGIETLAELAEILEQVFGELPDADLLRRAIDAPTSLLATADYQRQFEAAYTQTIEEQDTSPLRDFLRSNPDSPFTDATLALLGPSADNPAYLNLSGNIQRLLQQEGCGIQEVDGIFGVSSESAYEAFRDGAAGQCGILPDLPRVFSGDPIYSGWMNAARQVLSQTQDCDAVRSSNICRSTGPGENCARENGCLRGGVFSRGINDFCARYDSINGRDWENLYHSEDVPGSLYVVIRTFPVELSQSEAQSRIENLQRQLPTLPLRLSRAETVDGETARVVQIASGIDNVNLAQELALYASVCSRNSRTSVIAPERDAYVLRRGDGIMHISNRLIRAIGLDPVEFFGTPE